MIGRTWHGWTTRESADAYEALLRAEVLPGIHRVPGFHGAYLLRREDGGEVEFETLTLFASMAAVEAFAGADHEAAVVPPEARRLLARFDSRSVHYEVRLAPEDLMAQAEPRLLRAVYYRRLDAPGGEHCRLLAAPDGLRLRGAALLLDAGAPLEVEYEIACGKGGETRSVRVELTRGAAMRRLELAAADGRWLQDGRELPSLAGCLDVDLAITPSTNLLPIRRLNLAVGQSAAVTAAWVRFPDLTIEPLPQRYTRLAEGRYRYESRGGSFTADLDVDEHGFPIRYPPFWERAATLDGE
ncbi:MAG TPA: putative glycolipid-binding domain-containing protein [Thermoanaerobaculia bacterium]|jgi:hypothetical protein